MPTADQVAHIIVAAARELGANPIEVATYRGQRANMDFLLYTNMTRARYYSARALVAVYDCNKMEAARMVGVPPPAAKGYLNGYEQRDLPWWSDDIFRRVCMATPHADERLRPVAPAKSEAIPKFLPVRKSPQPAARPSISRDSGPPRSGLDRFAEKYPAFQQLDRRASERRTLRDMLAEAAENTKRMQDAQREDNE